MKRVFFYLIICIGVILLSGCSNNDDSEDDPIRAVANRTVIFYMMAENNLSTSLAKDISELVEGKDSIPDNTNIIIYLDDTSTPVIYDLTRANGLTSWKKYAQDQDSCDSLVVLQNIQDIIKHFPAQHYGLVMSSHGSGWVPASKIRRKSIGVDNTGTRLNITALRWVMNQLPKMDYLFFDACFMQAIEVAYELRKNCDWIIGSPAEIPGPGASYDKIVKALSTADIEGIVRGYNSFYPYTDPNTGKTYPGALLSIVKCNELDSLAIITRNYIPTLFANKTQVSSDNFQAYANYDSNYTHFFDMNQTMYSLLDENDYNRWLEYFNRAVPVRTYPTSHNWHANVCSHPILDDPEHYGGISMFVPYLIYERYGWNTAFHATEWYHASGYDTTGW